MTVELHLGGDWLAAAQRLCDLRRQSDEPGWALSLSRINGTLDLVLGEDNITAAVPPDAALVFLVDLLDAATALCRSAPKTIVRFSETPWELILTPAEPDTVALSLLGTGLDPIAVTHNRPVVARDLFDALRGAATEIRAALLDLDPGFVDNPLVARLTQSLEHLPIEPVLNPRPPTPDGGAGSVSGLAVSGASSLSFELDAAHPDLATFEPSEPLDLHALLASGSVVLRSGDGELSLSSGRPILTVMRLMDEVERLIRDLDARRKPTAVRGQQLLAVSTTSPDGEPWLTPLSVVWRPERPATALRTVRLAVPPPSLEAHLSPLELVALTAGLAEAICRAFVQANEALEGSARLADLRARGATLQGKLKARLMGSVSLDAPDQYLEARADTRRVYDQSVAPRPGQFPLDAMRRVSMRVRWSHTARGIDWGAIWLDTDRAVVPTDAGIVALALETGLPLFELPWASGDRPSVVRDGWVAAALHPDGRLQGLDLREGRVLWAQSVPSGWGRLVGLSRFDGARGRWWVIAADGGLCAIDPANGAVLWRGPELLEAISGVQARGAVLSVATDAGLLVGLDPVTGGVLWRTRASAGRVRWLEVSEDGRWGWAVGAGETGEASLWGVDRFEGRVRWRCALPGRPVGALIRGGRAVISVMGASAVSVDLATGAMVWEQPLSGLELAGPTAPLALDGARVLVKTDDGELWALDAESGARVWRTRIGGEGEALFRNAALQILDGVIVAAGSEVVLIDPSGGQVLHRLGELDGRPAWLRALPGPRLLVGDDDLGDDPATLSCYGAAHFLALVTAPR